MPSQPREFADRRPVATVAARARQPCLVGGLPIDPTAHGQVIKCLVIKDDTCTSGRFDHFVKSFRKNGHPAMGREKQ